MRNRIPLRKGSTLPLTFVILIVASLLTIQAMKGMVLQQQDMSSRFQTRQALEWIELGKLRALSQLQLSRAYFGETLLIAEIASDSQTASFGRSKERILIERILPENQDDEDRMEWGISVLQGNGTGTNMQASWRGKL